MIGDQLGDSYKQTLEWYNTSLKFCEDIGEFYRERAAIEREAAQKLQQLASKHFSRKAALSSAASVGPTPVTTAGSLENASLGAWHEILNQTEAIAANRKKLADQFANESATELGQLVTKWQAVADLVSSVHSTTKTDMSNCVGAVKQSKAQYDEACSAMEKSRAKGSKKTPEKEEQMVNAKNGYLLAVAVGNRVQQKHYYDDEPELLDAIEAAYKARTAQLNRILKAAAARETQFCESTSQSLKTCTDAAQANALGLDVQMYVKHNLRQWPGPTEMRFEPSPVWHEEAEFNTEEQGLRFLRARLSQADTAVGPATSTSQSIMEQFEDSKAALARADFDQMLAAQVAPLLQKQLSALKQLVAAETKRVGLETELETIETACRGHDLSSVPVTRTKTKRGLLGKKKEIVEVVQDKGHTSHSGMGIKSLLARTKASSKDPTALVLYSFDASGEDELSVVEGENLVLVERDDGSGWLTLRRGNEQGLVPSTYCEVSAPAPPPPRPAAASSNTVTAIYDFDAQDISQLSLKEGDQITVTEKDPGNGWTTGSLNGRSGIFPTSYVQ